MFVISPRKMKREVPALPEEVLETQIWADDEDIDGLSAQEPLAQTQSYKPGEPLIPSDDQNNIAIEEPKPVAPVLDMKKKTSRRERSQKAGSGTPITHLVDISFSQLEDLDLDVETNFKPRAHHRYKKKIPVEIEVNGRQFKTLSLDLSLGGALLADNLPEWVAGYCTIRLYNQKNRSAIELTCSVVENQDPRRRNRVEFLPIKSQAEAQRLKEWLEVA